MPRMMSSLATNMAYSYSPRGPERANQLMMQKHKGKADKNKRSKQFDKKATSLPHMDSSVIFARLRQRAPPFNMCFFASSRVHIPNGISIGSAVFAQITSEGPYTLQWTAASPLKLSFMHGGSGLPANTWFTGHTWFTAQMESRSIQLSLHSS